MAGEARDSKTLDNYLSKNGIKKVDVPGVIKQNDYRLGALQDARQLIKWAFDSKEGEVSEPYTIKDEFVVAVVDKKIDEGLSDVKTARPMLESIIRN